MRKAKEVALLKELEGLTLTKEERKVREGRGRGVGVGVGVGGGGGERAKVEDGLKVEAGVVGGGKVVGGKRRRKRGREGEEEGKRKEKLSVLQASVRRIKELEAECAQLSLSHSRDTDSWTRWGDFLQRVATRHSDGQGPSPLSRLPPAACDCLAYLSHQHALYTSSFIRTKLCFAVSAIPTGFILDANDQFLAFTGWQRNDILLHTFTRPYTHPLLHLPPARRVPPLVRGGRHCTRWVEDTEEVPQYPRSREAKAALLTGAVQSIHEMWRGRMADGRVWEFFSASWVSRWEDVVVEGMGEKLRVPMELSMMFEGREDALVQEIPPLCIEEEEE